MALLLAKHSPPQICRDAPPPSWRLSEEGRERGLRLAESVSARNVGRVVSSTEPKAIETAEVISRRVGLEVEGREGLHEHELAGEWFDDRKAFDEAVVRFFERPEERVLGRETAVEAALPASRAPWTASWLDLGKAPSSSSVTAGG